MTVVWGIVGMLGRRHHRRAALLAGAQLRHFLAVLRPPASAAHQRGDLRVRRLGAVRHLVLRRAAHLSRAAVRREARGVHVLGLAGRDRAGGDHAAAGHDLGQGIRRARMADRPADRRWSGWRTPSCSSARWSSAGSRTSTSPTGSSPRSSSPSRCCTSSTAPRCRCRSASRTPSTPARSMPWCSGGTATTRWAFS